jgi:SNF2 family DNA or RNA helicase
LDCSDAARLPGDGRSIAAPLHVCRAPWEKTFVILAKVALGAKIMSSSIWEQCGYLLSPSSLNDASGAQLSQTTAAVAALPVAAALDLDGDFRANDGCTWPKLNVAPKSTDEDLILDSSGAHLPRNVAKFLRPYQLEGVKFIYSHYARDQGCILADDMGLGKTVQTIAFFYVLLNKTGTQADEDALGYRNVDSPKVLLVLPASVMYQWQGELDNWMCCSACLYHGSKCVVLRSNLPRSHGVAGTRDLLQPAIERGAHDVVITSYDTVVSDATFINRCKWACIVADEAHKLKNSKTKVFERMISLTCQRRVALTGTPLQNNFEELWYLPLASFLC